MVAGDSSLAAFPGLSQDSLNMEPMGSPEPQALAAPEPPSQLGQLLASRKLEQALEQSQGRAHLSTQHCALPAAPWSRPGCVLAAEAELEGGPGGSRGVGCSWKSPLLNRVPQVAAVVPRAWACLPGQGLRYLEHLCLVLEQMARLQQLYLELRTQSPPAFLDLEEEEPVLDPLPSLPPAPGSGVQGSEELLSLTEETVKVLLNWTHWRSPGHLKSLVSPDGSGPRIESRTLSESSQCHPHRNTFMPSLVVKKQRAKILSIC
ncbi:hypothetical protein H920_00520 [Fukomys damarensis]|uniref:DUF4657 domain-containing protein n=1 Tax=Fukomys damarensis TaxID=885580 RepID=A0A091E699_FUKDA|nr:hypothetical protein H920_00520 [Fukomys damarensis]